MDLHTLFNCFIVGGFVVPVLNMVTGVIGGALGGVTDLDADADFDIDPDMDIDPVPDLDADLATDVDPAADAGYGKLPVNLMTLSLTAVVFGAVGRLLLGKLPAPWAVILALQAGVFAGFLLGWFVIRPLKRNRPYACLLYTSDAADEL